MKIMFSLSGIPHPYKAMHNTSVLIVDDNALVRTAVRRLFESHPGFQVSGEAGDGQEAVDQARLLRPDLVILDLAMPVLTGLQAAIPLRQMLPNVRLILFTGHSIPDVEPLAKAAGINVVVSKDQASDQLVSTALSLMAA